MDRDFSYDELNDKYLSDGIEMSSQGHKAIPPKISGLPLLFDAFMR
jgi:hypothetical protein